MDQVIPRPADDEAARVIAARLAALESALQERSAIVSQVTATSGDVTVEPWTAPSAWADVATFALVRPVWATSVTLLAGLYLSPDFELVAASTYVDGRVHVSTSASGQWMVSPSISSSLTFIEVASTVTWTLTLPLTEIDTHVSVAAQAQAAAGTTVMGGRVSANAVAIWTR